MTIPEMPLLAAQCWHGAGRRAGGRCRRLGVEVGELSKPWQRVGQGGAGAAGEDGEGGEALRCPARGVVVTATVAPADAEQLCDGAAGDVVGVGEAVQVGADRFTAHRWQADRQDA
jgi:hypothetical protein